MSIQLLPLILALVGLAAIAPILQRVLKQATVGLLAIGPALGFFYLLSFLPTVNQGAAVTQSITWFPQLGINLSFRLDGLGLLMGLLICGIGSLIVLYASGYLKGHALLGRFYSYLLLFLAAMLGIVVADKLHCLRKPIAHSTDSVVKS